MPNFITSLMFFIRTAVVGIGTAIALFTPLSGAVAADGSVLLNIVGKTKSGDSKEVSIGEIEAIGLRTLTVFNPYEKRSDEYSGVWLNELVSTFAGKGVQSVTMTAIDDYAVTFKAEEWQSLRILFATRVDGKHIGLEDKGPARMIFPDYDPKQEVYQVNLPKWMWMIQTLEFQ